MNTIVVNSSVVDNDEIVYPEDCESNSESNNPNPGPNPPGLNEKCCEKSYTIVLHFH